MLLYWIGMVIMGLFWAGIAILATMGLAAVIFGHNEPTYRHH